MAAYIIAQINVTDPESTGNTPGSLGRGRELPGPVPRAGGANHARGRHPLPAIVVTEFPDVESAKRFYHSVEYQAAREKRLGAADFHW